MLFNPRYGSVGLIGMPYYVLVEGLAPVFQVLSVLVVPAAWWLGILEWRGFVLMLAAMAVGNGLLTNAALFMNERGSHSHPVNDLLRLMLLGVADLFLYRPILVVAQTKGLLDFLRGRKSWNKFERNNLYTCEHASASAPQAKPDPRRVASLTHADPRFVSAARPARRLWRRRPSRSACRVRACCPSDIGTDPTSLGLPPVCRPAADGLPC